MPRLLILCEYSTLLGGERSMLATLPAVAAAGFEIHVAGPPIGPLAEAIENRGIEHVAWPTCDTHGERLPLNRLRDDLAGVIRAVQPDVLHANSLSTARIAGPVAAYCGVPSLGHLRDIAKLSRRAIDDLNAHRRLVAVSRATRKFHVEQGVGGGRCVVSHNGVDLDEFHPRLPTGYLQREFELPPGARLIAVIGQLGLRKGTEVALETARQIAADLPDTHWLIVGERTSNKLESIEFEAFLHTFSAKPPLAGRVHFLGSRNDVPQLLNECSLLVHTARQEPLGRVLLESAASGLAVVATDVGGTREIFPTEADGAIVVPPDDPLATAHAVRTVMYDEARRQFLANGGRRRAEESFDIDDAAARLVEQYQSVLM